MAHLQAESASIGPRIDSKPACSLGKPFLLYRFIARIRRSVASIAGPQYIYIYTYTYMHIHIYIHTYMCIYIYAHFYLHGPSLTAFKSRCPEAWAEDPISRKDRDPVEGGPVAGLLLRILSCHHPEAMFYYISRLW